MLTEEERRKQLWARHAQRHTREEDDSPKVEAKPPEPLRRKRGRPRVSAAQRREQAAKHREVNQRIAKAVSRRKRTEARAFATALRELVEEARERNASAVSALLDRELIDGACSPLKPLRQSHRGLRIPEDTHREP